MEHGKKHRKFGRTTKQRGALLRALAVALVEKERIETTQAKAKSLKTYLEKLITRSRTAKLANTRHLAADLNAKAAGKLMKEIGPRYQTRAGGYIRLHKLPRRTSDGAKMAIIELIK